MMSAITPPMMMISSVEPISEASSWDGVGVVCRKGVSEEKLPRIGTGAEYVSAALSAARTRLRVMAIVERTSFLIRLASISR